MNGNGRLKEEEEESSYYTDSSSSDSEAELPQDKGQSRVQNVGGNHTGMSLLLARFLLCFIYRLKMSILLSFEFQWLKKLLCLFILSKEWFSG